MLHRINLPACICHLDWIVQFQSDLLHALCDPAINGATVAVGWVQRLRTDIDAAWIGQFCCWYKNGAANTMLARMQRMASLSPAEKQAVISHYENNIRFSEFFDDARPNPPETKKMSVGLSITASKSYGEFFEMFYDPIFYSEKGYPIDPGNKFMKDKYLEAYEVVNPEIVVCPLCDGVMNGPEVDHWLAKKYLPELNCHPFNLTPICGECNKRVNKGEKLTMEAGVPDPFANWFHPYLRPACDFSYNIEVRNSKVYFVASDSQTKVRLDNLDILLNLSERWTREWKIREKRVRRAMLCEKISNVSTLQVKIAEWRRYDQSKIGLEDHAMLTDCFWEFAQDPTSDVFNDLKNSLQTI